MMDPDLALAQIEALSFTPRVEEVTLLQALGRVLAQEVAARVDSPPFAKAAMDGYGVSSADPSPRFRLVETVAAGQVPRAPLRPGECCKIMTGAMLPEGADKVLRVEFTQEEEGWVTLRQPEPYANVIHKGENLRAGDGLLGPRRLAPQDIGVLASQGIGEVRVAVPPRVGIITTGSELRDAGEPLAPGQIYNSNGPQLCAHVLQAGCPYRYFGVVEDDPRALQRSLASASQQAEVLLLSGGVSMGELDYVPDVLRRWGAKIHFHRLAVKPGKPTLFAQRDDLFIFGLPGNPVSTFVIFEVFVRALLCRLMGLRHQPSFCRGRLASGVTRRDVERVEYLPVRLEGGAVRPLRYHGSSDLSALRQADGLLRVERGVMELAEGAEVDVRRL
jgi:molybdopterin molybdotransferase